MNIDGSKATRVVESYLYDYMDKIALAEPEANLSRYYWSIPVHNKQTGTLLGVVNVSMWTGMVKQESTGYDIIIGKLLNETA